MQQSPRFVCGVAGADCPGLHYQYTAVAWFHPTNWHFCVWRCVREPSCLRHPASRYGVVDFLVWYPPPFPTPLPSPPACATLQGEQRVLPQAVGRCAQHSQQTFGMLREGGESLHFRQGADQAPLFCRGWRRPHLHRVCCRAARLFDDRC